MRAFLRRLRGLAGLALSAAIIWGVIGLAIGGGILILDPSSFDPGESALKLGYYFARSGLAIPFIAAGPQAMLPFFTVLGGGTGALTWVPARQGEHLAIADGGGQRRRIERHAG